jgi:hypothetical protein
MDVRTFVEDLDIGAGESRRLNCPVCKSYKTFTATNNMGSLLWNCYKASCSVSGSTRVHMNAADLRKMFSNNVTGVTNDFVLPEYIVPHDNRRDVIAFANRWSISADNLMYDVKEHRAVFVCYHANTPVDATGRALGRKLPKWKRYGNSGLPFVHGRGNVAVVVEGCVSAVVVGEYDSFVGVAILGTSLSESHKGYLAQFSTAVMALDPDALPKTLQYAKELRGYVKNVKVLRLNDDIKYRNPQDVQKLCAFHDEGEN